MPAAVIAWLRAKLVTVMSDSRTGAAAAQPRIQDVAAVLDHREAMRVGDLTDRVPVGTVAHEVRDEHRPWFGADHRFDLGHVDLERVGLDVDERRHDPRLHERRDVGGERECAG